MASSSLDEGDRGKGQAGPPASRTRSQTEGRHTNGVRSGMEIERTSRTDGSDSTSGDESVSTHSGIKFSTGRRRKKT